MQTDEEWYEAMKAKGHKPKMNEDYGDGLLLDMFVVDSGFHNGPGCEVCYWSCCMHCSSTDDIPECTVLNLEASYRKKIT
jgi:hypothetical protein